MAGFHSTSVAGVKAYIQNRVSGLYLNSRFWWTNKKSKVSFPTVAAARNYAEKCNAECEII